MKTVYVNPVAEIMNHPMAPVILEVGGFVAFAAFVVWFMTPTRNV